MRRRAAALAVVLCCLATACGVPNDSAPRLLAADDGAALLAATTTVAPPDPVMPSASMVTVYVLDQKSKTLHGVTRDVPSTDPKERVQALLDLELTSTEQASGLVSVVPIGTRLLGASVQGVDLVIDLSSDFTAVTGEAQDAVAQIVYTATETRAVTSVQFSIEGKLYEAPGEDGVTRPSLKRADFRSYDPLANRPPTTTSTTAAGSNGRR